MATVKIKVSIQPFTSRVDQRDWFEWGGVQQEFDFSVCRLGWYKLDLSHHDVLYKDVVLAVGQTYRCRGGQTQLVNTFHTSCFNRKASWKVPWDQLSAAEENLFGNITHLMCPKPSSGRYGSFLTWIMESYSEGCRPWATMLARITATIIGRMWEIWPVSSKQITAVDTVWVTAPVKAAAPVRNMGWDGMGGSKGRVQKERGLEGWGLKMRRQKRRTTEETWGCKKDRGK